VGTKFAEAVALLCAWAQKNKSILKRVDFNAATPNLKGKA
jgi:hypothetical protein